MEKKISRNTISLIKKVYSINKGNYDKIAKLDEKIVKLATERKALLEATDVYELQVKKIAKEYTGTEYVSSDLLETVVTPKMNADDTPMLDKNGYPMRDSKVVLKYPDTFFPVVDENSNTQEEHPIPEVIPEADNNFDADANLNTPFND